MSNYIYTNGNLYNADELEHGYKYIKKEPDGKGGYRYYYKVKTGRQSSMIAEKTETYGNKDSVYGVYKNNYPGAKHTVIKRRRNMLFGSTYSIYDKDGTKITYDDDGIIAQAIEDGKRKVLSLFKKFKELAKTKIKSR